MLERVLAAGLLVPTVVAAAVAGRASGGRASARSTVADGRRTAGGRDVTIRQDAGVKWSRAVAHLDGLADACADMVARSHPFPPLPVVALWAYGDVLGPPRELELVTVAVAVDLPVAAVGWLSEPPGAQHWAAATRMARNPVRPVWRSVLAPVWNHTVQRPLLLWDLAEGRRDDALGALRDGAAEPLRLPAPTAAEQRARLQDDLAVALQVLRTTSREYDERRWAPGRLEPYADALWRAGRGYLDLLDA